MTYCTQVSVNLTCKKYNKPILSPNMVIKMSCKYFGISLIMLKNKSRQEEIVLPRQMVAVILAKYTPMSLIKIAESIGVTNHATIVHHKKRFIKLYKENKYYKQEYDNLKLYLGIEF